MMQTKAQSAIETITSVAIGYAVALASQLVIFPLFDIHISLSENLAIGAFFTAVSIVRGYLVRRWFNYRQAKVRNEPK